MDYCWGLLRRKGGKAPAKNNALKETRKKTGKAKGKAGRPKKGSKVEVV